MKNILILLFFLTSLTSQAEDYYKSKLLLVNGKTLEGYATLPSNQLFNNSIRFKSSNSDKDEKIKNKEIYQVLYTMDSGNQYLFERNKVVMVNKSFNNKSKKKQGMGTAWILATYNSPVITVYNYAQTYYLNKEGVMISKSVDRSGTWVDIHLLVKRPKEDYPAIIGQLSRGATIIGKESKFRKMASIYFIDNKNLVERIKNKEFKSAEIIELAKAYSEYQ